jgi:hypothetical protein
MLKAEIGVFLEVVALQVNGVYTCKDLVCKGLEGIYILGLSRYLLLISIFPQHGYLKHLGVSQV